MNGDPFAAAFFPTVSSSSSFTSSSSASAAAPAYGRPPPPAASGSSAGGESPEDAADEASGHRGGGGSGDDKGSGIKKRSLPRVNRAWNPAGACEQCVQLGRVCTFEPPKRVAPRTYAESLEQRLGAMEAVLRTLSVSAGVELGSLLDSADDEEKTVALELAAEVLREKQQRAAGTHKARLAKGDDKFVQLYHQEEMTIEKSRYVGPSSGPFFARNVIGRLIEPGTPLPYDPQPPLVDVLLREEHDREAQTCPLPPPDLAAALIAAYFAHVNVMLPVLHRPSFERAIQAGMLDTDTSFRCLVLMVFAVGARFVTDDRLELPPSPAPHLDAASATGWAFFKGANFSLSSSLLPSSLFDIQTSVLGIIWLSGSTTPILAWNHVGWSIRRAVDVGAHAENRVRWSTSPLEDQLRKRAFHMLLAIDRSLSATVGRPLAMQDHESDLSYPVDIEDDALDEWNMRGFESPPPPPPKTPTTLSGVLALFRLQTILGKALQSLYGVFRPATMESTVQKVLALDSELNAWDASVPAHLTWQPDMPIEWLPTSVMLACFRYYCQIMIHREFLLLKNKLEPIPLPSLAVCTNAARSTINVLEVLNQRGNIQDAFWYASMQVGTAALVLMINTVLKTQSGSDGRSFPSFTDGHKCVAIVDTLSPHTFMASKVGMHMRRLMALVAIRCADPQQPPPPPAPVLDDPLVTSTPTASEGGGPSTMLCEAPLMASPDLVSSGLSTFNFDSTMGLDPTATPGSDLNSQPFMWSDTANTNWMDAFGGSAAFDFDMWAQSLGRNSTDW